MGGNEHSTEPAASLWNGDTLWGSSWSPPADNQFQGLPGGDGGEINFPQFQPLGPPQLYEVHLGQYSINSTNPVTQSFIRAVIRYGVGAASYEVICDWKQGSRITVPGGNIQVVARQEGPNTSVLRLLASICRSPGGHGSFATFTPSLDTVFGPNQVVQVPQRASKLIARPGVVFNQFNQQTQVQHMRISDGSNGTWFTATDEELRTTGVMLPGACVNLLVSWSIPSAPVGGDGSFAGELIFVLD